MTYDEVFQQGTTFSSFLDHADANVDLWHAVTRRVHVDEAALARIEAIEGSWRLLVLADDWCGDAVNTVPVIAALASAAPNLDLRVVGREDVPEIMDRHLTGRSRSIPVAVLLDEEGNERGWWGPRPRPLQEWFEAHGRALDPTERYAELRRWYARDHGATTCGEIAEMISCGAREEAGSYRGTVPCESTQAA